MRDPIEKFGIAGPSVSRRSILYGIAATVTAPVALGIPQARASQSGEKRTGSRGRNRGVKTLPRHQHTATPMRNGAILVAGGAYHGPLADARIFSNGVWSPAARLAKARSRHSATLLADGRVLVLGGFNGSALSSAEIYDPSTDTWTPAKSLATPRYDHAAALLPDGSVLVTGGFYHGPLGEPEIYRV